MTYYGFEYTPNGNCSYLGNGILQTFKTRRARDAWVAAAPTWGDFYLGSRLPLLASTHIRPHWSHKPVRTDRATF